MRVETKYIRKGKVLIHADTTETHSAGDIADRFDTINKAKAYSRKLQIVNGGLGAGFVKVWRKEG